MMLFRGISAIGILFFSFTTFALAQRALSEPSSLEACYAEIGDAPRTALSDCLNKKIVLAEEQLQVEITKKQTQYQQINASGTTKALESLRLSQQAFSLFQALECKRVADATFGGSGAGDLQLACQADLLNARIVYLSQD